MKQPRLHHKTSSRPNGDSRLASRAGRAATPKSTLSKVKPAQHKMTTTQPSTTLNASVTNTTNTTSERAPKRQKTHHLTHTQLLPPSTEPASQDALFIQSQLLRSLTSTLHLAGFTTVLPSALESFRAQTEAYMLHFLSDVKTSMSVSRRTIALPSDFIFALQEAGLGSADLDPHLEMPFPAQLSAPVIAPPAKAEDPPARLADMLGEELFVPAVSGTGAEGAGAGDGKGGSYIPGHFPPLPSRHAFLATPVFTSRELDARTIRERATDEGVLAEQALRRLMAAKAHRGESRQAGRAGRNGAAGGSRKARMREQCLDDVMAEFMDEDDGDDAVAGADGGGGGGGGRVESDGNMELVLGHDLDGLESKVDKKPRREAKDKLDALMRSGRLSVNHDRGHWRRGGAAVR